MAAKSPAELISSFRLKHGEVRVARDATLDRIALEQARAMAAKDNLSHEVQGSFTRRIAPGRVGRAPRTLPTAMRVSRRRSDSGSTPPGTARTCCCTMPPASGLQAPRTQAASAPYWAMVIAGDYEPKPDKGKRDMEPLVAVKREAAPSGRPKSSDCHIKVLSLCI